MSSSAQAQLEYLVANNAMLSGYSTGALFLQSVLPLNPRLILAYVAIATTLVLYDHREIKTIVRVSCHTQLTHWH